MNVIQRAYEIAREGQCRTTAEIGRKLASEGFESVTTHLSGPTIRRQLKAIMNVGKESQR